MRRLLSRIEALAPAPFIVTTGAIGGAVNSILVFFHGSTNVAGARSAQFAVGLVAILLSWTAAALLWWIAVRRRQFSIWRTAWHVTLALALADVLLSALSLVRASIETHGRIVDALRQAPATVVMSNLGLTAMRSVFWFIGALMLLALGRLVLRTEEPLTPQR